MTEDQYQQLREFVKEYSSSGLNPVLEEGRRLRAAIFSCRNVVQLRTRECDKLETKISYAKLEIAIENHKEAKQAFAKYIFDTSISNVKSDRERKYEQ